MLGTVTGDLPAALERLNAQLRRAKAPHLQLANHTQLKPELLLPLLHHALLKLSHTLAVHLANRGYELYAQADLKFVESAFKIARDEFAYRASITPKQFLSDNFKEHKLIFVADVLRLCASKASDLAKERSMKRTTLTPRSKDYLPKQTPGSSPRTTTAKRRHSRVIPHARRAQSYACDANGPELQSPKLYTNVEDDLCTISSSESSDESSAYTIGANPSRIAHAMPSRSEIIVKKFHTPATGHAIVHAIPSFKTCKVDQSVEDDKFSSESVENTFKFNTMPKYVASKDSDDQDISTWLVDKIRSPSGITARVINSPSNSNPVPSDTEIDGSSHDFGEVGKVFLTEAGIERDSTKEKIRRQDASSPTAEDERLINEETWGTNSLEKEVSFKLDVSREVIEVRQAVTEMRGQLAALKLQSDHILDRLAALDLCIVAD